MKNKEILKFIERELNTFTNFYWEIKKNKDYILFTEILYRHSVNYTNQEKWKPLWVNISDIIKDKEEMNKILFNLSNIKNANK